MCGLEIVNQQIGLSVGQVVSTIASRAAFWRVAVERQVTLQTHLLGSGGFDQFNDLWAAIS